VRREEGLRQAGEDAGLERVAAHHDPAGGVRMEAADIMIRPPRSSASKARTASPAPRVGPRRAAEIRLGSFYVALIRRLFHDGMPESLRVLVGEMQEWFIANSPAGERPTRARSANGSTRSGVS
jgi:hypothetical protein